MRRMDSAQTGIVFSGLVYEVERKGHFICVYVYVYVNECFDSLVVAPDLGGPLRDQTIWYLFLLLDLV